MASALGRGLTDLARASLDEQDRIAFAMGVRRALMHPGHEGVLASVEVALARTEGRVDVVVQDPVACIGQVDLSAPSGGNRRSTA